MANILDALRKTLYSAAAIVPRKITGFTAAVRRDFDDKGAALNDVIKIPFVAAKSAGNYTPAMTTTAGNDTTPTTVSVTIDNSKEYTFNLTGEDEKALLNGGDNAKEFMRQNVEQGIGVLVNGMESALFTEIYKNSSRATGTAGTNPFTSAITAIPDVIQILKENGITDLDSMSLVINSLSATNLMKLAVLTNNNDKAKQILETGGLGSLFGIGIRESAQIVAHTIGTGTGYAVNLLAGYPIGSTSIALDTGSNTILAGDVLTNTQSGRDSTNKYIVKNALSGGSLTLNNPGIQKAWVDNDTVAVGAAYTPNMLIHKNCAVLVARNPVIPQNANIEQMSISDEKTGMTFLFCRIAGDGMTTYRLHAMYGVKAVQSDGIATLLG